MRKLSRGFTLAELIIAIAVIGVLSTISVVGFSKYQSGARDSQRSVKVSIIAEALEKYYDQNGEYPSCNAITSVPSTITQSTLIGIDPGVFAVPSVASGTNSFSCSALIANSNTDTFAYIGDGSSDCASGQSCLSYTLQYREESTGQIINVNSRRTVQVSTSGTPTISADALDTTSISLRWTSITNALSYIVQYSTVSDFSTGVVTQPNLQASSPSTTIAGLLKILNIISVLQQ